MIIKAIKITPTMQLLSSAASFASQIYHKVSWQAFGHLLDQFHSANTYKVVVQPRELGQKQ